MIIQGAFSMHAMISDMLAGWTNRHDVRGKHVDRDCKFWLQCWEEFWVPHWLFHLSRSILITPTWAVSSGVDPTTSLLRHLCWLNTMSTTQVFRVKVCQHLSSHLARQLLKTSWIRDNDYCLGGSALLHCMIYLFHKMVYQLYSNWLQVGHASWMIIDHPIS